MKKAWAIVQVETPFRHGLGSPIALQEGISVGTTRLPDGMTQFESRDVDQATLRAIVTGFGHKIKASVPEADI